MYRTCTEIAVCRKGYDGLFGLINCVFKISFLRNVLPNYQFSILIDRYRCVHHELLSVAYGDSGERTDSLKPEMTVTQYCFFLLIWL